MASEHDKNCRTRRNFLAAATTGVGGLIIGGARAFGQANPAGAAQANAHRPLAAMQTSSVTLKLGEPHPTTWVKNDTNASIDVAADGTVWMILGWKEWTIYRGTSMDNLVLEHTYQPDFARPHGDDLYWPSGLWIDPVDGKWYCAVHCEYQYGRYTNTAVPGKWSPDHRRRMVLTTSSDHGRSWTMIGDILTGDNPEVPSHYTGDYYDKGPGDAHIFMDEHYFYAFYREGWYQKSANRFYEVVRAARCAKSERMAPGKWHKWYKSAWNEPGLGGHDTDVFNSNSADTAYVFYSTSLRRYVALIGAGDWNNPEGYIATCTDLNLQNWTNPIWFADTATHQWYNWATDNATQSRHVIGGKSFRYYTSVNSAPVWREATFIDAPAHPIVKPPLYPPASVDDYNAGWDWQLR